MIVFKRIKNAKNKNKNRAFLFIDIFYCHAVTALYAAVDEPRGMARPCDLQRERVDAARGLAHHRVGT